MGQLLKVYNATSAASAVVSVQIPEDATIDGVQISAAQTPSNLAAEGLAHVILSFNQSVTTNATDVSNDIATVIVPVADAGHSSTTWLPLMEKVFQGERLYLHVFNTSGVSFAAAATMSFSGGTAAANRQRNERGRFTRT